MLSQPSWRLIAALAAVLAGAVAGCGSDDEAAEPAGTGEDAACIGPRGVPAAEGKPEVEMPTELTGDLEITDLREGDGPEAELGQEVEVHYVGVSCSTGEQFDASWDRGAAITFPLVEGGLIQGWIEGVPGMRVGGQRQLVIPPDLGYGAEGRPGIAPGETLVFVIDLVSIA